MVCLFLIVFGLVSSATAQTWASLGPAGGEVPLVVVAPSSPSTLLAIPGNDQGGLFLSTNGGTSWSSIAPGICDAHVIVAAFHPATASTIYAGTSSAGVCKSTDSGATWTALTTGLPLDNLGFPRQIDSLAINPATPATLLAGTSSGLSRSTDGGATWSGSGIPGVDVRAIAISPSTPATAYANTPNGIYKSINSGVSWGPATTGLPSSLNEGSMTIDPTDANVVYLTADGVYKTSSGGGNWTAINTGLGTPFFLSNVTVDPTNSNTLYVNAIGGTGFAKSSNGGTSWSAVSSTGLPSIFGLTGVYESMTIDSTAATHFIAGSPFGAFTSTDSGATWISINAGLATRQVTAPALIAGTGGGAASLLVGSRASNDGGDILQLTAGVLPFSNVTSPFSADDSGQVRSIAFDPTSASTIYVLGGKVSGQSCPLPFKTTNGGSSWTLMNSGLASGACGNNIIVDPATPTTLYLSMFNPSGGSGGFIGLYKSTNGGTTWAGSASGINNPTNNVALSPLHANILYAATFGQVFKTANSGAAWSSVSSGLPGSGGGATANLTRVAINPTDDNIVYAATGAGVYRTANGGTSWNAVTTGWPTLNGTPYGVGGLAIDPATPTTVYAAPSNPSNGPSSFLGSSGRGIGLFKSTDSGANWTAVSGAIAGAIVTDIVFDGTRAIFATTNNGVFRFSSSNPPTMTLDRATLKFAATSSGTALTSQTAAQTVRLTQGTGTAVTWTATSDKPWLTVTPASGSGSAAFSVAVKFDSTLPASGNVTGRDHAHADRRRQHRRSDQRDADDRVEHVGGLAGLRRLRHAGRRRDGARGIDRGDRMDARQRRREPRRALARSAGGRDDAAVREHAQRSAQRQGVHLERDLRRRRAPGRRGALSDDPVRVSRRLGLSAADVGPGEPGQRDLQALRLCVRPGEQRLDDRQQDDRRQQQRGDQAVRIDRHAGDRRRRVRPELRLGADAEGERRGDVQDPAVGRAGLDRLGPAAAGGLRRRAHRHRRGLHRLLEHRRRPAATTSSTGRR